MKAIQTIGLIWILALFYYGANAQGKVYAVKGKFDTAFAKMGEHRAFSVTVLSSKGTDLLFPDSSFSFAPFELVRKDFFPTKTTGNVSKDSAVYWVATYELDSIQKLQIPVFEINGTDSSTYFSNLDSLKLSYVIPKIPVKPEVLDNQDFFVIAKQINYPYIIIGVTLVVILLLFANFFFGKPIQKNFYLFLLKRRHSRFIAFFEKLETRIKIERSVVPLEDLIVTWKQYIQRVDGKPYTTFTTKEIGNLIREKSLIMALQNMDKWLYGTIEPNDLPSDLLQLKKVSINFYEQKKEAIRNGKFD